MIKNQSQPGSLNTDQLDSEPRDLHNPAYFQAPLATSVTTIIKALYKGFNTLGVTDIFDPALQVKTTLRGEMLTTSSKLSRILPPEQASSKKPKFPLFAWNREPIALSASYKVHGSYGKMFKINVGEKTVNIYAGAVASIKVNWKFIAQNMPQLEQFEILYQAQQHIHLFNYLDMVLFDEGPFVYEVVWDDKLNSLQANDDDIAYNSVSGTYTITGPMLVILQRDIPRIEEIVFRLYVTSAKSPICKVALPELLEHSVLEIDKVVSTNK
jgi:hypothetical protein